ncbi:MAG: anthranilate synthase component I family protein [Planctomycetes bacterium]|nr:anthranilate synthase component I family protein [Planctomycetota bacterium]
MATKSRFTFRPRVRRLDGTPPPEVCLSRLRDHACVVLLHSAAGEPRRYSLLAFDPLCDAHGALVELRQELGGLRELRAQLAPAAGDVPPPQFAGGVLAALAYDLGVHGEALELPRDVDDTPHVVGGLYTDYLLFDHERDETLLVLGDDPGDARAAVREREARVMTELASPREGAPVTPLGPLVRELDGTVHRARVEAARERIAAGEIYQANLAHAFHRELAAHPVDLYLQLARVNPAPYMAHFAWRAGERHGAILSASPELLLELENGVARTRPIKGTAARHADPELDARAARELLASAKDRAELAMIVDLERNDLGRVAVPGSVRATGFPTLTSYASVHHLSADVSATVRPGLDAADVLAACFPGGSISGAPKLSSMEAIAALEGEGRGFFTGSLGSWDLAGRACFNILIRTLCWTPGRDAGVGRVRYHVGGGITWGSDPASEERETLVKGERLARALEGAPQVALESS